MHSSLGRKDDIPLFDGDDVYLMWRNSKKNDELLARITVDPMVCFGKPCIRGHRIWVSLILDFLASGMTIKEILADYPDLEEADVYACIAYGAEMARDRYIELPASIKN